MTITMGQADGAEKRPVWAWSAREIATLVRSGQMTATAVIIGAHLERIDTVNPSMNALTLVFMEQARALALDLDRRIAQGDSVGALAGVPFSVKENLDLTWPATTDDWLYFSTAVPSANSTVVQRMLDADAIPIGRGNMPPKGLRWDTHNELFGRTYNPWARDRVAGGSSGGDAVAVATGMVPLGLGTITAAPCASQPMPAVCARFARPRDACPSECRPAYRWRWAEALSALWRISFVWVLVDRASSTVLMKRQL